MIRGRADRRVSFEYQAIVPVPATIPTPSGGSIRTRSQSKVARVVAGIVWGESKPTARPLQSGGKRYPRRKRARARSKSEPTHVGRACSDSKRARRERADRGGGARDGAAVGPTRKQRLSASAPHNASEEGSPL